MLLDDRLPTIPAEAHGEPSAQAVQIADEAIAEITGDHKRYTAAESRTDFPAIKSIYDNDAVTLANKLRAYIAEARDSLVNLVERQAQSGPLTAEFAQSVKLSTGPEFAKDVEAYLMDVWRRNRDAAIAELPEKIKGKLLTMRKYAEEDEELPESSKKGIYEHKSYAV